MAGDRRRTDGPKRRTPAAAPKPLADDLLTQTSSQDDTRINVDQDQDLKYWSTKLAVSTDELRRAVQAVGPVVMDVKRYLFLKACGVL